MEDQIKHEILRKEPCIKDCWIIWRLLCLEYAFHDRCFVWIKRPVASIAEEGNICYSGSQTDPPKISNISLIIDPSWEVHRVSKNCCWLWETQWHGLVWTWKNMQNWQKNFLQYCSLVKEMEKRILYSQSHRSFINME